MSRLLRCNRCGQEHETPMPVPNLLGFTAPVKAEGWAIMTLGPGPVPARYDLCEDCAEVLVEQFMVGANVHAITQPPGQNVLPHDNQPYQDCLLAWDPDAGGFVCEHDDPERFLWLQRNRAQNVAEGVPEQMVDKTNWVRCKDCDCTSAASVACQCECHLPAKITQVTDDMHTSGWAHSTVQRCSAACSEQHTYVQGCILKGVVQNPPPNPCGHMYPGTPCDWNHCATPGRLISQQGEDLTEAYSPQEAAE